MDVNAPMWRAVPRTRRIKKSIIAMGDEDILLIVSFIAGKLLKLDRINVSFFGALVSLQSSVNCPVRQRL